MMKSEFDERVIAIVGKPGFLPVSDENWTIINQVYTFHPAIPEQGGKEKMAQLYVIFGMTVIKDMEARATLISHLEAKRLNVRMSLETIEQEIKEASN